MADECCVVRGDDDECRGGRVKKMVTPDGDRDDTKREQRDGLCTCHGSCVSCSPSKGHLELSCAMV